MKIVMIIDFMRTQDEMRLLIKTKLAERGRGSRKKLADFLGMNPNQITRMLNTEKNKIVRAIKLEEWFKIEEFFNLGITLEQIKKPKSAGRERYLEIYDSSSSEVQKMLLEFAEFLSHRARKR